MVVRGEHAAIFVHAHARSVRAACTHSHGSRVCVCVCTKTQCTTLFAVDFFPQLLCSVFSVYHDTRQLKKPPYHTNVCMCSMGCVTCVSVV